MYPYFLPVQLRGFHKAGAVGEGTAEQNQVCRENLAFFNPNNISNLNILTEHFYQLAVSYYFEWRTVCSFI